jgi:hypothetical protein
MCLRRDVCHGAPAEDGVAPGFAASDGDLCNALADDGPFGDERAPAPTTGGLTLPSYR